jgi:hypothetical protein
MSRYSRFGKSATTRRRFVRESVWSLPRVNCLRRRKPGVKGRIVSGSTLVPFCKAQSEYWLTTKNEGKFTDMQRLSRGCVNFSIQGPICANTVLDGRPKAIDDRLLNNLIAGTWYEYRLKSSRMSRRFLHLIKMWITVWRKFAEIVARNVERSV